MRYIRTAREGQAKIEHKPGQALACCARVNLLRKVLAEQVVAEVAIRCPAPDVHSLRGRETERTPPRSNLRYGHGEVHPGLRGVCGEVLRDGLPK